MKRYFLKLCYKGTLFNGFQIQQNAKTIQSEVEKALQVFYKTEINLTGSSRTDAGVHAIENYFHFDTTLEILQKHIYNLNAILPDDIVLLELKEVNNTAHCRFDALYREYKYYIYQEKNPFLKDKAFFYPYALDFVLMQEAANLLMLYQNFTAFSKKHTQVNNFNCAITKSHWIQENDCWVYNVQSNRFLRGMVRALVATMLKVGRGQISIEEFKNLIEQKNSASAFFDAPAHGLFLVKVEYPTTL
ncbi:MAG: tRNA pseudouridine(38-40) synthase TruA [Chitinophagaceae bacterium]|nr:tRNA pseudouridine(38-40) synthase TruA [Chitinophagaceae bacterium]